MNQRKLRALASSIPLFTGSVGLASLLVLSSTAQAAEASSNPAESDLEEVVVTGYRGALASGLQTKKESAVMVDEINAEDAADFPDRNLAESLQRLPGISISKAENGEGQRIAVRGLGADFTTTTINGMDVLVTSGGGNSDTGPNRTRGFDFNVFASELFSSLLVQKSASAATDEGSLGATVALSTGHPLAYGKFKAALSAQETYYENGHKGSPRLSGLIAKSFFDDTLGLSLSAAYSKRDSVVDRYNRNVGQFEYLYRNSQHASVTPATFGFARPTGFVGNNAASGCANVAPSAAIVGCGSDPAAYAKLTPTTIFPTLPTLSHRELGYERLGITQAIQWKPSEKTELNLDTLYGKYRSQDIAYELTPVGANRNSYNFAAATGGTLSLSARQGLYPRCAQSATAECGQTTYGTTKIAGTDNSYNPYNLDPIDYYNWTGSPGYVANSRSIAGWAELVGRPNMQLRDVSVVSGTGGQQYVNYMVLDNVDWRDATDGSESKNTFAQGSLNLSQELTSSLHLNVTLGKSKAIFHSTGLLIEFNAVDRDGFVFDEQGNGKMPSMSLGFDPADSANWSTVKGLSTIRNFRYTTRNEFTTGKLDLVWKMGEHYSLNFGGAYRKYQFLGSQGRRTTSLEAINPTTLEAKIGIADIGRQVKFGAGLSMPPAVPTQWFAPDWNAFDRAFGVNCNCTNQWGDWRAIEQLINTAEVTEKDKSGFVQLDFNLDLSGHKLFGNVGLRTANTAVTSNGAIAIAGVSNPISGENKYNDFLPSMNLNYEVIPDLYTRFAYAKVMARPTLFNLALFNPSAAPPSTCTAGTGAQLGFCSSDPQITIGNPKIDPFRANNFDFSLEWYFAKESLLSAALFYKSVKNNPQAVRSSGVLSAALVPDLYNKYVASLTNAALRSHINNGGNWLITQVQNAPGGYIRGYELNYQQPLTFLPAPFNNLGVQANYTHLESKLSYITNPITGDKQDAPYLDASPDAFNATIYYQNNKWEARFSGVYRKEFMQKFPISSGSCLPGLTTNGGAACNAPLMLDFIAVKNSFQLDFSYRYDLSDLISLTLEAQNLLNEPVRKWVYQDVKLNQQYSSAGRIYSAGIRIKL